jgi:hypothetical protein
MLEVYWTADGSPTLIVKTEDGYQEKMHHSGGAWTETLYIYHPVLKAVSGLSEAHLLSLGLGLGYNELMSCAHELTQKGNTRFILHSFELLDELREDFSIFLREGSSPLYGEFYRKILSLIAEEFHLEPESLRTFAAKKLKEESLLLLGPFPESLPKDFRYHGFFYDAFSNKMDPHLWTEEFLQTTLDRISANDCILSTYAATGALKRSLRALGFTKILRPGFAGKRDSSLYVRGRFHQE